MFGIKLLNEIANGCMSARGPVRSRGSIGSSQSGYGVGSVEVTVKAEPGGQSVFRDGVCCLVLG